ncbi:MAG: 4-coumarate--CoA ligase family protein [Gemmatimonadetes bacterium]|nr:4-coumarate--CoA ligase family protein [Gemmatimonadota bacterium]
MLPPRSPSAISGPTSRQRPCVIHRSRFPDVVIPDVSLTEYVFEHVEGYLDRPALIDDASGRTLTYRQLLDLTGRVSAALASRGFGKGSTACIFSPNVPEYAAIFFGVARVGATNTTANPMYTAEELAKQLADSGARIVFTVPSLAERALAAAHATGAPVVVLGEAPGCLPFADFIVEGGPSPRGADVRFPAVPIDSARDIVTLPYSSGTTGLPKGVMLTHRNLVANLAQCDFIDDSGPGDHTVGFLPFFHIYGMVVILGMVLRKGAAVITLPQFDLEAYLRINARYKCRSAYIVPPIALALAKHPMVDDFDLSALEMINSGAAPLGAELEVAVEKRLGCIVKQGYGMTETSPVTHFTPNDRAMVRHGSCGLIVANTEVRVVDLKTKRDVGIGEQGELLMRGPQVMKGYLNAPEATEEAIDHDGWLHTGDVAYVDAEGYFYIVDRLKEFIKYKGYQVAPAELEALLLTHPAVADAAVIPKADPEAGEVPKAFIVKRSEVTADEIMAFVAEHAAPYKKVRVVEFIERIPKSASGKILRRELIAAERAKGG